MRFIPMGPLAAGLAWFAITTGVATGRADDYVKLAAAEAPPPKELAEPIRSVLPPKAIRLLGDGKPFFEFWFRKEIPLAGDPPAEGFALAAVKEGTVLGALKVHEEWYDFKDEEIPPGVYVLRLGLIPEDGDHMGTSPTRTFALLIPADKDRQLEGIADHDKLAEAASAINAAEHPSTLNLQRVQKPDGPFPRLASHDRDDHEVLYLRLPGRVEGGDEPVMLIFGLVYEGMGQI